MSKIDFIWDKRWRRTVDDWAAYVRVFKRLKGQYPLMLSLDCRDGIVVVCDVTNIRVNNEQVVLERSIGSDFVITPRMPHFVLSSLDARLIPFS